jgi:hypothetical protein
MSSEEFEVRAGAMRCRVTGKSALVVSQAVSRALSRAIVLVALALLYFIVAGGYAAVTPKLPEPKVVLPPTAEVKRPEVKDEVAQENLDALRKSERRTAPRKAARKKEVAVEKLPLLERLKLR